jgi:predicted DNA-binding transcriptional regulator AlpA
MQDRDLIIGLDEISSIVGRSRPTVRLMIENDQLPAVKIRHRWVSSKSMLNNYIRKRLRGEQPAADFAYPSIPG